ncbi:gamma-2-syntrophin isoform X1 [Ischnura elegans]|uniref:gamma-2-syntrophin isoform X1 n=1 Tax=Ischnura elegans TaxID=197161 RepID=UPI001ED88AD3|nr:gamma-2-syntrophin isoform X1 [Ischnura elegans]
MNCELQSAQPTMGSPIEEIMENNMKVRMGMVAVSDGKSCPRPVRLHLTMETLRLQAEEEVELEEKRGEGEGRADEECVESSVASSAVSSTAEEAADDAAADDDDAIMDSGRRRRRRRRRREERRSRPSLSHPTEEPPPPPTPTAPPPAAQPTTPTPKSPLPEPPPHARERTVKVIRQKVGGLGLSIKGGAEHHLPILISRIFKDQAADQTGQLFVGDAIVKVNDRYVTTAKHDDAVSILRNAGDTVHLTVKHYRAATPFLQASLHRDERHLLDDGVGGTKTPQPEGEGWRSPAGIQVDTNSRRRHPSSPGHTPTPASPVPSESSLISQHPLSLKHPKTIPLTNTPSPISQINSSPAEPKRIKQWVDVVTVPLMMAYVTRYIFGTDQLRPNAFEVRGLDGSSTGVVLCEDTAVLTRWLKYITDNVVGLTNLQLKICNRNFARTERIEYMGWVNEASPTKDNRRPWQSWQPRFLALKGPDVLILDAPPLTEADWSCCTGGVDAIKVYQTMFRAVRDSENVDGRQHCFLVQASGRESRYLSVETRQELLRIEGAWHCAVCSAVMRLGSKTFTVSANGKTAGLTLDWNMGFALYDTEAKAYAWKYKFSQLKGSSDDGKCRLKLHFLTAETRTIETKELECSSLQALLFCMHAFLTAKVASVDPTFLSSKSP